MSSLRKENKRKNLPECTLNQHKSSREIDDKVKWHGIWARFRRRSINHMMRHFVPNSVP